jgi:hypothetical protein
MSFYKERDPINYWGGTNFERMLKKIGKEYTYDEYMQTFMSFFDEIKKEIYPLCKFNHTYTTGEILIFKKFSKDYFTEYYNENLRKIIF